MLFKDDYQKYHIKNIMINRREQISNNSYSPSNIFKTFDKTRRITFSECEQQCTKTILRKTSDYKWKTDQPMHSRTYGIVSAKLHLGRLSTITNKGFAPVKQLYKEDKKTAKEDEVLQFKVTEFNKDNRRIVLSHTSVWKADNEEKKVVEEKKKEGEKEKVSKATKKLNDSNEKSTFGDIDALSQLKTQMDGDAVKKASKKAEALAEKAIADKEAEEKTHEE